MSSRGYTVAEKYEYVAPFQKRLIERDFPTEQLTILAQKEGNRKKPIYEMHKWWARRLGANVRSLVIASNLPSSSHMNTFLKKFYNPDVSFKSVVFDPFMGGGTSLIESSKLGARTIGVDIDPIAWFITKKELEYCNPKELWEEYHRIEVDISSELKKWYKTKIKNGKVFDVIYYFWVSEIKCPKCENTFECHPHYTLSKPKKNDDKTVFCKKCHAIHEIPKDRKRFKCHKCSTYTTLNKGTVGNGKFTCPYCKHNADIRSTIEPGQPLNRKLFALEYLDHQGNRKFKKAAQYDTTLYEAASNELSKTKDQLIFPREHIPTENRSDNRPLTYGFSHYYQLFNDRQLLCISLLFKRINEIQDPNIQENLLLAFSDSLASNNVLCGYAFGYGKLTPLFSIHGYRAISRPVEGNVWGALLGRGSFVKCAKKLIRAKEYAENPYEFTYIKNKRKRLYLTTPIHKDVATNIEEWAEKDSSSVVLNCDSKAIQKIPSESVDIILTDPPYYDNLAYSELSDFYYVWLKVALNKRYPNTFTRKSTPIQETIMVIKHTETEHDRYTSDLIEVFNNCRRIIKDNGIMVFTYHHNQKKAWLALGTAIMESRFTITNVFPILSEGKSGFHSSPRNIKWDSVFVCRVKTNLKKKKFSSKISHNQVDASLRKWVERLTKSDICLTEAELESFKNSLKIFRCAINNGTKDNLKDIL